MYDCGNHSCHHDGNTDIIETVLDVIGMQQTTTVDIQEEVHPVAEAVRLCF